MVSPQDSSGNSRRFGRRLFLAAGFVGIGGLAACGKTAENTNDGASASPSASPSATSASPTKPAFTATAEFNVKADQKDFKATEAVEGTVTGGKFVQVELWAEGAEVETPSAFSEDAKTWNTTENLLPQTSYTLTYTLEDDKGETKESSLTFTSDDSKPRIDTSVNFTNGATLGVGWIVQFDTSYPVTDKATFEKAITFSGGGNPKGAFRWYNDQMVRYRPETYWAANSTVSVTIDNEGKDLGGGREGNTKDTLTFNVGPKRTALADNNTKTIQLFENDKLIHSNLITLGNEQWPSVIGKLVVMEQADSYYFDPTTLGLKPGDAHYYTPFYAHNVSRLTQSGVFVHQALPTAYSSVGVANVSHGCIGMLPDDAKYFFDVFGPGDIVETVNTGYPQADPDDGYGDWNIPFANYSDTSWKGNW